MAALADRRRLLLAAAAFLAAPAAVAAPARKLTVYKTPWCGCCGGWVAHMKKAGFQVTVVELEDLAPIRKKYGVPDALASCHTGVSGGYALEGHVPAADVERLLRERPKALGLTVPGMPMGSPGMENPAGRREAFDTLLILPGAEVHVFARHAAA